MVARSKLDFHTRTLVFAKRIFVRSSVWLTIFLLVIQFTPLVRWYAGWLGRPLGDPDGDILIVLSSEAQPDGIIGLVSYGRAVYAIRAWREGHFRAVVVSGGNQRQGSLSLAAVIGQFLVAYGIPKDRIFLEERSTSTHENALFTKQMIGNWPGKRVLVTSESHMFRARRAFDAVGLTVTPRPFPDVRRLSNRIDRIPEAWSLCLETAKIVYYWQRGWIHLP